MFTQPITPFAITEQNLPSFTSHSWTPEHFENRGTIYSYFDFSLKQQFSVALPTP